MKYRANRHPVDFKVVVLHSDRKLDCTMVDVSESGARLHRMTQANVGDDVTVVSSFGRMTGQVKWVRNEICGVEFAPKVPSQMVDAFRRRLGHLHTAQAY